MNVLECFEDLKETWFKYCEIDHPEYTSTDFKVVENFLDNLGRLLKND